MASCGNKEARDTETVAVPWSPNAFVKGTGAELGKTHAPISPITIGLKSANAKVSLEARCLVTNLSLCFSEAMLAHACYAAAWLLV